MTMQRDPEGTETQYLHDFAPLAGATILEVGSGMGRLVWRYASTASQVVGIDPSYEPLMGAVRDCPSTLRSRVGFIQADAVQLPFVNERFNVVLLGWSL